MSRLKRVCSGLSRVSPLLGVLGAWAFLAGGGMSVLLSAQVSEKAPTAPTAPAAAGLIAERPYSGGAVELVFRSQRLGRDYAVVVTPPVGDFAARGRKFPAIYALDGGYGIAGPLGQFLGSVGMMSLAYVVSIGAPDADRVYDFIDTPVESNGAVVGGGGQRFREFLIDELRPYLEARFAIDPTRSTLFGHSLGGAFTAGVLSRSPGAFSAYVIASPALWADPELPAALSKVASKGGVARIYLSVGENERADRLQDFERISAALSAAGSTFTVERRTFAGETHVSYLPQLVTNAFGWLLPADPPAIARTAVSVSEEMLERLVGVYELTDGRTITITRSGTQMFSQVSTSTRKAPLLAESSSKFFVSGFDYVVTFEEADNGVATGLIFRLNGAEVKATRRP
jgi:predicted alpha/beta superfamily hydrolase